MDMREEGNMIYKHESLSLWEQKITGILLNNTKDFVTLSKSGMHIIGLGEMTKRALHNNMGRDLMLHSLQAKDYLKCDKSNCLFFKCSMDENQVISI